ncbi:hypothetical protein VKT23_020198 [Stygiomarasmius scandens]|uniref:Uncharacterized protein n=1 Tax=Marasmiellus scandens TaxID=2682957 RepID=A0ABR1ILF5_9AGAR
MSEPSTPWRTCVLPPFTPIKADESLRALLASPTSRTPTPSAQLNPLGNKLIIRNLYNEADRVHDPLSTLNMIVTELTNKDEDLAAIPVIALPFKPSSPHPANCYLALGGSLNDENDQPRTDLLSLWKNALKQAYPSLKVDWVSMKDGSDKRMLIRMPTVVDAAEKEALKTNGTPPTDKQCLEMVIKAFRNAKMPEYNAYVLGKSVFVELVHTKDVDAILSNSSIHVPELSSIPIPVSSASFIPIKQPLEIVIAGVRGYEPPLEGLIREWIHQNFADDEGQSIVSERLAGYENDLYIISCATWQISRNILQASQLFSEQLISQFPNLSAPKLLFSHNTEYRPVKKSTRDIVSQGGDAIAKSIADLSNCIQGVEKEQRELSSTVIAGQRHLNAVQDQMSFITSSLKDLHGTISVNQQQSAIMANQLLYTQKRNTIENSISSLEIHLLQVPDNQQQENYYRKQISSLRTKLDELEEENQITLGLSPPALPPPPPQTQDTPTTPSSSSQRRPLDHPTDTRSTKKLRPDDADEDPKIARMVRPLFLMQHHSPPHSHVYNVERTRPSMIHRTTRGPDYEADFRRTRPY